MDIQPVILSGGSGTRLWPLSREHYPKQLIALCGENTLLQDTVLRLDGLEERAANPAETFSVKAPLIIANEEHRFLIAEQLRQISQPFEKIILEPVGRNTAPALTLAALAAVRGGDDPILLVMPADHVIQSVEAFQQAILQGAKLASDNYLVTFGIVPDAPETGYGYIKKGEALGGGASQIAQFVEKPDQATAETYLDSGQYLWNSGMFMMRASVWLAAIEKHQPKMAAACKEACEKGREDVDFYRVDHNSFEACPSDSIDYAVMERITALPPLRHGGEGGGEGVKNTPFNAAVIPLNAQWSDVGSWSSLWEVSDKGDDGNVIKGDVYTHNTKNSLLISEYRLLATAGLDDVIVVETADAVMVAAKDHAQDVKKLVESLKGDQRSHHQSHRKVYRPWGCYESIDGGDRFQVKRITVKPGASLSLQMHHHRAEHWVVVRGTAKVTCGEKQVLLTENQSTYIPIGVTHRLENPGTIPLDLIEVQSGSYLGEDDIVRFEDVYGR
ncbi:mannose-1-phosphate guanyltransferase [Candidatus Tenderia electrophaga]|jgi:mannose-1-phosphate guanylyltransferase/mannose-6-phosphate isomerase|uniref:Mannose-1-phosphate guanyltransferase n=1 Tax=Candidatus Tenderia electrophaga TaxID=1748243 RepID=A0A0S2TDG9_9GAMM|nr:mannose-1-phosphate guanyltransferase [Candidatus Tenderia electrophaga]